MARIRHLSKAPITEAILDFRTRLPSGVNTGTLKAGLSELTRDYPQIEEAWLLEGSLAFTSEAARPISSGSRKSNGYVARTADGKQVAQFRLDGFTFSRLSPYTSWEMVAPETLRLWEIYCTVAKPEALYRVAVRYINHIRLPDSSLESDDILMHGPKVPGELPQRFASFLTRVVVPLEMPNTHVSIVQAYNVPPAASADTIMLDLDVFRNEEMELSSQILPPVFERLREFKNRAFFGSLTDAIVESLE